MVRSVALIGFVFLSPFLEGMSNKRVPHLEWKPLFRSMQRTYRFFVYMDGCFTQAESLYNSLLDYSSGGSSSMQEAVNILEKLVEGCRFIKKELKLRGCNNVRIFEAVCEWRMVPRALLDQARIRPTENPRSFQIAQWVYGRDEQTGRLVCWVMRPLTLGTLRGSFSDCREAVKRVLYCV
jgi:hypothetical protein